MTTSYDTAGLALAQAMLAASTSLRAILGVATAAAAIASDVYVGQVETDDEDADERTAPWWSLGILEPATIDSTSGAAVRHGAYVADILYEPSSSLTTATAQATDAATKAHAVAAEVQALFGDTLYLLAGDCNVVDWGLCPRGGVNAGKASFRLEIRWRVPR
jgi:hypothetical protein